MISMFIDYLHKFLIDNNKNCFISLNLSFKGNFTLNTNSSGLPIATSAEGSLTSNLGSEFTKLLGSLTQNLIKPSAPAPADGIYPKLS
jgi:hypothetical protein